MPSFFQGSMRCKNFVPFLRDVFAANGWTVIDSDVVTHAWFVMQRVSDTGGIMTFLIRERDFPNYGVLTVQPGLAIDNTTDVNGVYLSGYDPVTKSMPRGPFYGGSYDTVRGTKSIPVAQVGGDLRTFGTSFAYYSGSRLDPEDSPVWLFYSVSIHGDSFLVKVNGNPATTGATKGWTYGGAFDSSTSNMTINDPCGLWGCMVRPFETVLSRQTSTPRTEWWWIGGNFFQTIMDFATASRNDLLVPMPSYSGNPTYPLFLNDGNHPQYPLILMPKDFMMATQRGSGLNDEAFFVDIDGSKFMYFTHSDSKDPRFVWVTDSPSSVSVIDNGTGNAIGWVNPTMDHLGSVKVYAKIGSYPTSWDDAGAVEIFADNAPVSGATGSFVDSDPSRYGQDVHYAVVSFQDQDAITIIHNPAATVVPVACMITKNNRARVGGTSTMFDNMFSGFNPEEVKAIYTNKDKFSWYYPQHLCYPCDDSAENNVVVDITGRKNAGFFLNGTPVNTSLRSVAGKVGNAFNIEEPLSDRYVQVADDPSWRDRWSMSLQMWFQLPDPLYGPTTFMAWSNGYLRYVNRNGGLRFCSLYGNSFIESGILGPVISPNEWHSFSYVRNRALSTFYVDTVPLATYPVDVNIPFGSGGTANIAFAGSQGGGGIHKRVDQIEFFIRPLAMPQIKLFHNDGNGMSYINIGNHSMFSVVSTTNAVGEKVRYNLDEPVNLSGRNNVILDAFSNNIGSNFLVRFGNENGSVFTVTPEILTNSIWEEKTVDVSSVPNSEKQRITFVEIESVGNIMSMFAIKNVRVA